MLSVEVLRVVVTCVMVLLGLKIFPFLPLISFGWIEKTFREVPGQQQPEPCFVRLGFSPGVHYVWPDSVLPPLRRLSEA